MKGAGSTNGLLIPTNDRICVELRDMNPPHTANFRELRAAITEAGEAARIEIVRGAPALAELAISRS